MSKRKKIIIPLIILAIIMLPIVRLFIPCPYYKFPFLYSMISLIEGTDIPRKINEDDENIVQCRYADIDFSEKKIIMEFYIHELKEAEIFSLIVNSVNNDLKFTVVGNDIGKYW